jgi:hypothetical protein
VRPLGTPQELTDHKGRIAWSAQYKAWGEAKQAISEAGRKAGIRKREAKGSDPRNYDFRNQRYQKIDDPKTGDHHVGYGCGQN